MLRQVRALLGPYLVYLASTVNGYEGTGRALTHKLIQQLRTSKPFAAKAAAAAAAAGGGGGGGGGNGADGGELAAAVAAAEGGVGGGSGGRSLREVTLSEPIRYARGDPIEAWLHDVLCLDATAHSPPVSGCPHPSECELYWVDRDALFSCRSEPHTRLKCPPSHMRPRGDVMPTLLSPNDRPRFGNSQLATMPVFGRRDV